MAAELAGTAHPLAHRFVALDRYECIAALDDLGHAARALRQETERAGKSARIAVYAAIEILLGDVVAMLDEECGAIDGPASGAWLIDRDLAADMVKPVTDLPPALGAIAFDVLRDAIWSYVSTHYFRAAPDYPEVVRALLDLQPRLELAAGALRAAAEQEKGGAVPS